MNSLYLWLKAIHVAAAAVWIGAALTVVATNARIIASRDRVRAAAWADICNFAGRRILAPAGGVVFIAGIGTAVVGKVGMPLWVWIGFGIAVIVLVLGGTAFRVGYGRLCAALEAPGEEGLAIARRMRVLGIVSFTLLVIAVFAMVLKPA